MVQYKCLVLKLLAYALNPIESGFFSQNLPKNPEKQTKSEGIPPVGEIPLLNLNLSSPIEVLASLDLA